MVSTILTKNREWKGRVALSNSKTLQEVCGKLKQKLQTAVPVLRWYFFNLNEITVMNKEK